MRHPRHNRRADVTGGRPPSSQRRARKPKVFANRLESSSEFAGRRALVGNSAVVIAMTGGLRPVRGACAATMRLAKPCHVVTPVPAKVIGLGQKFVERFSHSPYLPEVRMKLGQIYSATEDHANAETQFTLLARENP